MIFLCLEKMVRVFLFLGNCYILIFFVLFLNFIYMVIGVFISLILINVIVCLWFFWVFRI